MSWWVPERWGPKGGAPKGWSQEGVEPRRVGPRKVGGQFRAFFFLSRHSFYSILPLLLVFFVEFWWCVKRRCTQMCTFGEPKRAHLIVPAFKKHHQNSTRRHPEREEMNKNCGGRGKKGAKFWAVRRRGSGRGWSKPTKHNNKRQQTTTTTHNNTQHTTAQRSKKQTTQNTNPHQNQLKHNNTKKWIGQNWLAKHDGQKWIGPNWTGQSRPLPVGGAPKQRPKPTLAKPTWAKLSLICCVLCCVVLCCVLSVWRGYLFHGIRVGFHVWVLVSRFGLDRPSPGPPRPGPCGPPLKPTLQAPTLQAHWVWGPGLHSKKTKQFKSKQSTQKNQTIKKQKKNNFKKNPNN